LKKLAILAIATLIVMALAGFAVADQTAAPPGDVLMYAVSTTTPVPAPVMVIADCTVTSSGQDAFNCPTLGATDGVSLTATAMAENPIRADQQQVAINANPCSNDGFQASSKTPAHVSFSAVVYLA